MLWRGLLNQFIYPSATQFLKTIRIVPGKRGPVVKIKRPARFPWHNKPPIKNCCLPNDSASAPCAPLKLSPRAPLHHSWLPPWLTMTLPAAIPLALYIHIPWCERKCPYCDFNSHAPRGDDPIPEQQYIQALLADLEQELPLVWGRRISSIFIGGGTPSLFSADGIATLLQGVRALLPVTASAEITLEANPGSAEADRFQGYREAGINRLSIGIQSFDDTHLKALGRIHSREQAQQAVHMATEAGFQRINLDLMFGLPEQTPQQAEQDLSSALELHRSLGIGHLSWYQLTLEPNTLFHRHPPPLPADDRIAAMQANGIKQLQQAGFQRYEISAYSIAGQTCRHNLNYWEFGDYIGIGAGAHGKISSHDRILRRWRHRHPRQYMQQALAGQALSGERLLEHDDLLLEFMMNALRLQDGVPMELFRERTRSGMDGSEDALSEARQRGWLEQDPQRLQATAAGLLWLNDLLELFVPD